MESSSILSQETTLNESYVPTIIGCFHDDELFKILKELSNTLNFRSIEVQELCFPDFLSFIRMNSFEEMIKYLDNQNKSLKFSQLNDILVNYGSQEIDISEKKIIKVAISIPKYNYKHLINKYNQNLIEGFIKLSKCHKLYVVIFFEINQMKIKMGLSVGIS